MTLEDICIISAIIMILCHQHVILRVILRVIAMLFLGFGISNGR